MAALALKDVLPDFGAGARGPHPADQAVMAAPVCAEPPPPRHAEPDPQVIAAAIEAAEAALAGRLNSEHEASLVALAQAHAAETDEIRREAASIAGPELAARLDTLETRLVELTGAATARILASLMAPQMQARAMAELDRVIREALGDREVQRIRVSGPVSFREALMPALGAYGEKAEFTETRTMDVSVSIDDTIYETRLAAWSAALSEVLD